MSDQFWYETGDITPLLEIDSRRIICFDTETTGLDPWKERPDEILQLAIVRGDGEVLFNELIKPRKKTSWKAAQEIHGISPAMVRGKQTIDHHAERIREIFASADLVVGYNLEFDMSFLAAALGTNLFGSVKEEFDVMHEYAPVAGDWDERREGFRWKKLSHCARHYGFKFEAHDALEDARATLYCFFEMLQDNKPRHKKDKMTPYLRVVEIYRDAKERKLQAQIQVTTKEQREVIKQPVGSEQAQLETAPVGFAVQAVAQPTPSPSDAKGPEKKQLKTWQKIGIGLLILWALSLLFG